MKYLILKNSITDIKCDAVVNSANQYLMKGSGICKSIYEMAGEEDLNKYLEHADSLTEGECIATPALKLPAKYIFHVLTPKYYIKNDRNIENFSRCYASILQAAEYYRCETIAIPCIGTGHHGWPLDLSSNIAIDTLYWIINGDESRFSFLKQVVFSCPDWQQYLTYKGLINSRKL